MTFTLLCAAGLWLAGSALTATALYHGTRRGPAQGDQQ